MNAILIMMQGSLLCIQVQGLAGLGHPQTKSEIFPSRFSGQPLITFN